MSDPEIDALEDAIKEAGIAKQSITRDLAEAQAVVDRTEWAFTPEEKKERFTALQRITDLRAQYNRLDYETRMKNARLQNLQDRAQQPEKGPGEQKRSRQVLREMERERSVPLPGGMFDDEE